MHIMPWLLSMKTRLELLKKKSELAAISFSNPSVEAFINLSETFHETGESREALVLLKEAKKKISGERHS
jgi:hypothetical protein